MIGDNLMHKYQAIASFHIWVDLCKAAMDATKQLVLDRGAATEIPDFEGFWAAFERFEQLQHAHGRSGAEIMGTHTAVMEYDIGRWIADGMPRALDRYRHEEAQVFEFALSEEGRVGLGDALEVWTTELKGLTKMMKRIRVDWQVRESRVANAGSSY